VIAKNFWELGDQDVDLVIRGIDEDRRIQVGKDAVIADVPLGPGDTFGLVPAILPESVQEEKKDSFPTLGPGEVQSLQMSIGDLKPGESKYTFTANGRNISLKFAPLATVADARKRLARTLGVDSPDCLTLMSAGKALRDAHLLKRLGLEGKTVSVLVRNLEEIMVLSQNSLRRKK
jgi:hypothetical protein